MTDGSPQSTPAGWYPDPSDQRQQRYWSGTEWTQDVHPAADAPGEFVRPWWQQWWAIGLTLLLCTPLGVIGVWQRERTPVGVKVAVSAVALVLFAIGMVIRSQPS